MNDTEQDYVWVLTESGVEHSIIVGIFTTEQAAYSEKRWCEETDSGRIKRISNGYGDPMFGTYIVNKYALNRSSANILYRFNIDGVITRTDFFCTTSDVLRDDEIKKASMYPEPWDDGTCMDAFGRTESEARAKIAALRQSESINEPH